MERAVYFDAVGTLIHPQPAVAEVYAGVGRRWGINVDVDQAQRRFRAAFRKQDELDRTSDYRTDEGRERRRWTDIVHEVFGDQPNADGMMEELWQHFAKPESWTCLPNVATVLETLASRGLEIGIASNFDSRLRSVVAGLPALRGCQHLAISSEIGWRKPAPQFFAALGQRWRPDQVLLVGDDLHNDYEGGQAAGLQVVLFAPHGGPPGVRTLTSLAELLHSLGF